MAVMRVRPAAIVACILLSAAACRDVHRLNRETTKPTYDSKTGRLLELTYDSNVDGHIDTWIDMDGARPLRARIDRNQDGRLDRWEEYDSAGRLVRVGYSRQDDGQPDAWAYPAVNGRLERVEMFRSSDLSIIDRREVYDPTRADVQNALLGVEEDTNGDGRIDKWETFEAGALKTAAWDENGDGIADRRFTYRGAIPTLLETDPDPNGRFMRVIELR
jgi:hypothetical protein